MSTELGVSVLRVDFAVLAGLSDSIERSIRETEEALATLSTHVSRVAEIWTGAASEGFQRTVADWLAGQRDLRVHLQDLHDLVIAAHDNHAQAVRANVAMWRM